ncbi:MAG: hypothetical protein KBC17_01930 [Candidatus Pacebacteria bacterium]|nr:hypothetical protein [Candidatus Paceibacterota bacterium]
MYQEKETKKEEQIEEVASVLPVKNDNTGNQGNNDALLVKDYKKNIDEWVPDGL